MTTSTLPAPGYPVEVTGRLDTHLSRWLWLVKWVLIVPHLLVLVALWAGFVVLSLVALVSIVVTGRYPRAVFDYNVGVLRWSWRVCYYAYGALGTDEYPPFTLAERPDYPATLHVDYPAHLSRGLALVKWWLLAIPHYLVVGLFVGGGAWVARQDSNAWEGPGLVGILVLVAGVVLLVTGSYPATIFDFVLGMNRWALRVAAYAGLMTDRYPPFRLDQGGDEPGGALVLRRTTGAGPATPLPGWTGARSAGVALGGLVCLIGLAIGVGGGALLVVDQVARDDAGFVSTGSDTYRTGTAALVSDVELHDAGTGWLSASEQLGTVALTVRPTAATAVFVGIAPQRDVTGWLQGSAYDRVTQLGDHPAYDRTAGARTAPDPTAQTFWVARAEGTGSQHLRWHTRAGHWTVVVMNADGTPGVAVRATAGATLPHLAGIGAGVLGAGAVFLAVGAVVVLLSVPRRKTPADPA